MNGRGPVRPRRWQDLLPLADWGSQGDVMNGHGLVQPCRLQNLLLLGGARGDYELALVRPCRDYGIYRCSRGCYDVMNGHGLVRREIAESIAARGRSRGCYE